MVIQPCKGWIGIDWAELLRYREVLFFLVWRDWKVRHKQTVLGMTWSVVKPVFSMVVMTVIFGKLAKIPSDGLPYAVFVYAGILPWHFFSAGVVQAGGSLVQSRALMTKIYFPRLFLPAAAVAQGLVDLVIASAVYACVLAIYGFVPSWGIVLLPFLVLFTALAALGLGCVFAAMMVAYRDFRAIAGFTVKGLMYLSPVIYPVSLVPKQYHWLLALNPMAGIIDAHRSAILGKPWNLTTLGVSGAATIFLFVFGVLFFRRAERRFADIA